MPITAEQAWDATDPSQPDEVREVAATQILAGVAANDAYLASRGELERLKALSAGGQVVSHAELNSEGETPTVEGTETAGSIEGTAEDEKPPLTQLGTPGSGTGNVGTQESDTAANEAVLRKQLEDAGMKPVV